jgi:predicted nucleic acid-binding protein
VTQLYIDASVVLRILFGEPGPRAPLTRKSVAVSSELIQVECFRALDHARLSGHLDDPQMARKSKELFGLLANLHLFPVSAEVLERARATFPIKVRALNALHVATAQAIAEEVGALDFWTHDVQQASAATVRGLDVRGVASVH